MAGANCDAERCTDFILSSVTFTDGAGFVIFAVEFFGQHIVNFDSFVTQFLGQRQYRCFYGSDSGMEMQNSSYIVFTHFFFVVSFAQECLSQT